MKTSLTIILVVSCLATTPPWLKADTTFGTSDHYVWGANIGWISFRHDQPSSPEGVVFGEFFLSGYAYSANLGWINLGDGTPDSGYTYANVSNDHGVNRDSAGNLSGYAWSANTGWINFGWATLTDANRPRVNLLTGTFSGYAWSANTGWINLGTNLLTTASMLCPDTDMDGISDHWELKNFGDLTTANNTSDQDGDGSIDLAEYFADTDPNLASSYMQLISQSYNSGYTEVTLRFTTSPSRLYRIEYSTDLGITDPWTDSSLGTFVATNTTTTKTVTFAVSTPVRYFFRAVAIRPLSP